MRIVLPVRRAQRRRRIAGDARLPVGRGGQMNRERRALPQRAVDGDVAADLQHDAVDRREAEPGTAVRILRREERLEDARARLVGHADAGVADLEHDVAARRSTTRVALADVGVARRDAQRAAAASSRRAR